MREHGDANGDGRRAQLFLAAAFLVVSLAFYLIPTGLQQNVASSIRLTLLRPFVGFRSAVSVARLRRVEADALHARLDSLNAWIANNVSALEENRRLRALSGLAGRMERTYGPASVFRPGNRGSQGTLVLDLGRDDGVHASSSVITPAGLAGRVIEAHATISIGMDWTHPDFRVSVMTEDGELYGIAGPEAAPFGEVDRLVLTGIPYYRDLADGALVVTSGRGGVFPRGVPVGLIGGLAEVEEGWHRSYWVYPSVHPASVTHALVDVSSGTGPSGLDLSLLFHENGSPARTSSPEAELPRSPTCDGGD